MAHQTNNFLEMRKNFTRNAIGIVAIVLMAACGSTGSITKRHYTGGWQIALGKNKSQTEEVKTTKPVQKNATSKESIATANNNAGLDATTFDNYKFGNTAENTSKLSLVEKVKIAKAAKSAAKDFSSSTLLNIENTTVAKVAAQKAAYGFDQKTLKKASMAARNAETDTWLLVVIAFFIPPLAVYLYEGEWTKRCTVNLILTLLCGLPGLIHALVVILGNK